MKSFIKIIFFEQHSENGINKVISKAEKDGYSLRQVIPILTPDCDKFGDIASSSSTGGLIMVFGKDE